MRTQKPRKVPPVTAGLLLLQRRLSGPDLRLPRETMGQGRRGQVDQLPSSNEQLSATKAANWRLDGVDHVLPLALLTGGVTETTMAGDNRHSRSNSFPCQRNL